MTVFHKFLASLASAPFRLIEIPKSVFIYLAAASKLPEPNFQSPQELIKKDDMSQTPLSDISDNDSIQIGFARKQAFVDQLGERLPLYHSAVALKRTASDGEQESGYIIIGRQSPFLSSSQATRNTSAFHQTKIDNEVNYIMPAMGAGFKVTLPEYNILVSGKELKEAIEQTTKAICEGQLCSMVISNCYSGSMYLLMDLVEVVHSRVVKTPEKEKQRELTLLSLGKLVARFSLDTGSMGLSNNLVIAEKLSRMIPLIPKGNVYPTLGGSAARAVYTSAISSGQAACNVAISSGQAACNMARRSAIAGTSIATTAVITPLVWLCNSLNFRDPRVEHHLPARQIKPTTALSLAADTVKNGFINEPVPQLEANETAVPRSKPIATDADSATITTDVAPASTTLRLLSM